jgi:DNA-binding IclR family transcriptional regulator
LTLGEIARRTRLHKTTVLRIARTMAAAGYLVQLADGSWRLGPASGWLGSRYNIAFDAVIIEPVLSDLSEQSGESTSFYVREGKARICIARVNGPQSARYHVRIGEIQPLDKGAPGRVLLAFSDEPGEPYERIRRLGYHSSFGERDSRIASVAYPVFGVNHAFVGCVSVFGPRERFDQNSSARYVRLLRKAAAQLTFELGVSHSGRAARPPRNASSKAPNRMDSGRGYHLLDNRAPNPP